MAPIRLSEKEPVGNDLALPTHDSSYELPPKRRPSPKKLIAICLAGSLFGFLSTQLLFPSSSRLSAGGATTQSVCQQSPILTPRGNVTDLYSEKAKERIIDWLSGAVKVPTEAYDDMADVEGSRGSRCLACFTSVCIPVLFVSALLIPERADLEEKFPSLQVYENTSARQSLTDVGQV